MSELFSPGILPAERPSHLYLKRIPLCFGCSKIWISGCSTAEVIRDNQRSEQLKQSWVTSVVFMDHDDAACLQSASSKTQTGISFISIIGCSSLTVLYPLLRVLLSGTINKNNFNFEILLNMIHSSLLLSIDL